MTETRSSRVAPIGAVLACTILMTCCASQLTPKLVSTDSGGSRLAIDVASLHCVGSDGRPALASSAVFDFVGSLHGSTSVSDAKENGIKAYMPSIALPHESFQVQYQDDNEVQFVARTADGVKAILGVQKLNDGTWITANALACDDVQTHSQQDQ
jgi:hypothetical protein